MKTVAFRFPSVNSAWHFLVDATQEGWKVSTPDIDTVSFYDARTRWFILIGALLGAVILGSAGALAEWGVIGIDRLEPLFASPVGAVALLYAVIGGCLGALIPALGFLGPISAGSPADAPHAVAKGTGDQDALAHIAGRYGGEQVPVESVPQGPKRSPAAQQRQSSMTLNHWLAWGLVVVMAAGLITATGYIWILSAAYGSGADQESRIGWTLKNVQRIPGDTPEQTAESLAMILGGPRLDAPSDPIAAAILAPLAASRGQTLVYGGSGELPDLDSLADAAFQELQSPVVILVSVDEPAYAMPAAFAAAQFQAPIVPVRDGTIPGPIQDALANAGGSRTILVAAPERLIPDSLLADLRQFGMIERVADENIYRHALTWARDRFGDFGWGIDDRVWNDGYYYFAMANPETPAFAAAGLPMAYQGNYGPLLYSPQDDLDPLTDQYLWRLSPDFFVSPSDGPFMNVRVLGGPEDIGYNAQARADLALETHDYRNQVTGTSGLALLGWSWVIIGIAGAVWALFAMPVRLPGAGFFPRLYWPLAMLVLGPLGIMLFFLAYGGRLVDRSGRNARYMRPAWARGVSATIMSLGIGMALMVVVMWAVQLRGMPLFLTFAFTPLFWVGAPMTSVMWMVMVLPAIVLSTFFFMGPMMAVMHQKGYLAGVRMAAPIVILSMISASVGMWSFGWYFMSWQNLRAPEDLWLWIVPLWAAMVFGFFTAYIPNYLMVRFGWKEGEQ
jgi:hypothetical protein